MRTGIVVSEWSSELLFLCSLWFSSVVWILKLCRVRLRMLPNRKVLRLDGVTKEWTIL